jgi:type 1 glutamine amidotransferase
MKCRYYYIIFLLVIFNQAAWSQDKVGKRIRVLIIDGYSNHDWKQTTSLTKSILEESKLFSVDISTAPATTDPDSMAMWDPEFKNYQVIIQNSNNYNNKSLRWPRKIEEKLQQFVTGGGGLYVLHSANNSFPEWKEYDTIMGMGWRPKEFGYALEIDANKNIIRIPPGEGNRTSHGKRFDAVINIYTRHPINKGFPDKWITPSMELYTYVRGPAVNTTVLSWAYDTSTNKNWPVEWVVRYGKGRVYNSSMGHLWKDDIYPVSYRCIGFQTTMIRVTEWLATGKVTYPVPAKFPKEKISMRDESDYPHN